MKSSVQKSLIKCVSTFFIVYQISEMSNYADQYIFLENLVVLLTIHKVYKSLFRHDPNMVTSDPDMCRAPPDLPNTEVMHIYEPPIEQCTSAVHS